MSIPVYLPIVKARDGEIRALLSAHTSTLEVTPLLELQRAMAGSAEKRTKSSATDASYFLDDVARQWSSELYLDVSRVSDASTPPAHWWKLIDALSALSQSATVPKPVVHQQDSPFDVAAAAAVELHAGGVMLRIRMPHANPTSIASWVSATASQLGLQEGAIDVVLDWRDELEQHRLDDLEKNTNDVISAMPQLRRVAVSGTPNCADCTQAGDWEKVRREWWLWQRVHVNHPSIVYGDYALHSPGDPVPAGPRYGHLRYSCEDRLWVHRRARPKQTASHQGGLSGAFRQCCNDLTASTHFCGTTFSPADQEIDQIGSGMITKGVGDATKWRELALSHHLAVVDRQLSRPGSPPLPGTA